LINNLYVDANATNVLVSLSGGADSSIIYYALCDYYKNTNTNVIPMTMSTYCRPHIVDAASRVIDIVGNLTGYYPIEHVTYFNKEHTIPEDDQAYTGGQRRLRKIVSGKYKIDIQYGGVTSNPPERDLKKLADLLPENSPEFLQAHNAIDTRDKSRDLGFHEMQTLRLAKNIGESSFCYPFAQQDKKAVYEAYVSMDALETIYPFTLSCENDKHNNFTNYKNLDDVSNCGRCFFCLERLYGFGKL